MVEILLGVWLTCFIFSAMVTAWNVWYIRNTARSTAVRTLNWNLKKVGLYWSLSSESTHSILEGNPKAELKKIIRNYLLLGCLGFFSVIGFLLLTVVSLSMRFLVSRQAKIILASELTTVPELEAEAVQKIVDSVKAAH